MPAQKHIKILENGDCSPIFKTQFLLGKFEVELLIFEVLVLAAARSPHGSVTLSFALSVSKAATCLAAARSRFGSCIINAIHYQNAVSLPGVRGFTLAPLRYVVTYVKRFARLL